MYSRADSLGYPAEARKETSRKEYRPFRALGVGFLPLLVVGIGITCGTQQRRDSRRVSRTALLEYECAPESPVGRSDLAGLLWGLRLHILQKLLDDVLLLVQESYHPSVYS